MILRGYIDESFNSKMFTLSCLLATPYEWNWIESRWKGALRKKNKELKKAGRPQISRYHATDCANLKREFADWDIPEQIEFTKELIGILKSRECAVIAYSVPLDDYATVFPDHAANNMLLSQANGTLMKFLMSQIVHESGGPGKKLSIALFHDRSSEGAHIAGAVNQMLVDPTFEGKAYFSSVTSMGWENCIPLQVADFLAYETFKDSLLVRDGKPRRKSLEALLGGSSKFGGRSKMFDVAALEILREAMQKTKDARLAAERLDLGK
jgi:hypothetical protein